MKTQNYKEEWDFYMGKVDHNIASIYLDLGLRKIAPVFGKENIFWISIVMNNPRKDGLSSQEESSTLWEIEDEVVKQIGDKHDVIYSGRLTNNGSRVLYFYCGNDKSIEETLVEHMLNFPSYEYDFGVKEHDNWETYFNFLYPSPRAYQTIMNRRVLAHMDEQGDKLEQIRQVDHWIYFKTEQEKDQYIIEVSNLGFTISNNSNLKDKGSQFKHQLVVSRVDSVNWGDIDSYTIKLWEIANTLNAEYTGWEAPLIVENQ